MGHSLAERIYIALAPWLLLIIESLLVVAAVALIYHSEQGRSQRRRSQREPATRRATQRFLNRESPFSRLARRKPLAILVVGLGTLAVRVALIPLWGVPQPAWHDEFSYLLASDTFAHGRLTNPTHPMWIHFEGFHIIQQPTYMSMYPPGQGLVLALGQLLGHPWIGQLLTTAVMTACLCWMLQAWVPPSWALLGACLAAVRLGILSYWMNSYFGTSLPAIGGALLLGALPRLQRRARIGDALLMGIGLAVLANTRPFEGFIYSLPIGGALLVWIFMQKKFSPATVVGRVVLPLTLVLAVSGAAMTYYFWRVTGHPLVMPYEVNRQTYAVAPYFVWQKPRPEPVYHHAEMRNFYVDWELRGFQSGKTVLGFLHRQANKVGMLWAFYVGPVFTLPFLAFPWLFRDHRMRLPLIIAGAVAVGTLIETWTLVHYLAPALGLFFLLLVQCLRHLRLVRWRGVVAGQALARAVPVICVAMVVLRVGAVAAGAQIEPGREGNIQRNAIERELREMPGKQLVIVHYGPTHVPHIDWVNNRADIDASKIVWARDMGVGKNAELLLYFKDRRAWRINADDPTATLETYSGTGGSE
jgi:hypothetical protein